MMRNALHIAPMMGYTHRHFRYLMRHLCPDVLLYSEMITTGALLYGEADRYLRHDAYEQPVVLQLGGNDPSALAQCARMAEQSGYHAVNLNVGCPSSRVQEGGIGASLYADWARVAACVAAMRAAVAIPVTVKCRIGVDHCDTFDYLVQFTDGVAQAGCDYLIVHARKAWLQGLNPKQNRTIPPLRYDIVKALSQEVDIPIVLNGGLTSLADINQQLMDFPAVMVGRYACSHPLEIARFKSMNHRRVVDVLPILEHYFVYMERCMHAGERVTFLLQPLHGFFRNQKGAKCWRQLLASVQTRIQANEKPTTLWPEVVSQLYALQMTD